MGRPVTNAVAHDPDGHGTHTAGIMVGRKIGMMAIRGRPRGSACRPKVIEGGNVIARILAGLNWLVGLKVRVISLSLGLRGYRPDFLPVIQSPSSTRDSARRRGRQRGAGHEPLSRQLCRGPVGRGLRRGDGGGTFLVEPAVPSPRKVLRCPAWSPRGRASSLASPAAAMLNTRAPRWRRCTSRVWRPCYSGLTRKRRRPGRAGHS